MDKNLIHLDDFKRMLIGDNVPISFFIEIIIRGIFVYIVLIVALRLM